MVLTSPCELMREFSTGDTLRVLLYVQLNRTPSGGSASTSHLTCSECMFSEPTEVCSVPGLQRGATVEKNVKKERERERGKRRE